MERNQSEEITIGLNGIDKPPDMPGRATLRCIQRTREQCSTAQDRRYTGSRKGKNGLRTSKDSPLSTSGMPGR